MDALQIAKNFTFRRDCCIDTKPSIITVTSLEPTIVQAINQELKRGKFNFQSLKIVVVFLSKIA